MESFDPIAYINEPRWRHSSLGLDRMHELLDRLNNPQHLLRFVHVAGTNGKGSVCSYLASILLFAGYRTGLFTSPYIEAFEERIRINGSNISNAKLRDATLLVRKAAEAMAEHPTEFELMLAVALVHFAREKCDIVILEVGLGGRLDATNVIERPEVCVITRLGLDHTDLLGSTLADIAAEKAGIIKNGTSVVSWPQDLEALKVITDIARKHNATFMVADFSQLSIDPLDIDPTDHLMPLRFFTFHSHKFETQLLAAYQPYNAALAIDGALSLRKQGWNIPDCALVEGIANTRWAGRFEVVAYNPLVIVDGGHNLQGAQALAASLRELLPNAKPVFIIGILEDKDYQGMLKEVLALASNIVALTPNSPRALPANKLAETAQILLSQQTDSSHSPSIYVARGFSDAVAKAYTLSGPDGVICAFGSLYSIGALKTAIRKHLATRTRS